MTFFKREALTRIFYAGDIHGSERLFVKFLNAGKAYKVSILIMGGDLAGKAVVPLVRENGGYRCRFMGRDHQVTTQDELKSLRNLINHNGFYPYVTDSGEIPRLESEATYREEVFAKVARDYLERWLEIASEKLSGSGIRCYIMPGNDDPVFVGDMLTQSDLVCNPEGQCLCLDDHHEMISLGYSNPTPWHTERELPETELRARMEQMAQSVQWPENLVVNFHAPPYDSGIDTAAELSDDFRIKTDMGRPILAPVGSKAVREFIEAHQPLLGLHGHIHDAEGMARIGRTLCINPGSAYADGVLSGAIVGLKKDGLAIYQMVRG
jgi:Icc-related predicted phosphoesterase